MYMKCSSCRTAVEAVLYENVRKPLVASHLEVFLQQFHFLLVRPLVADEDGWWLPVIAGVILNHVLCEKR